MKFDDILNNLPEVEGPKKIIGINRKFMWTGICLVIYFVLTMIPLYGLDPSYESQFEMISVLLAAGFGSLITLGIGPIITGSIILQLLTGADVIKIDTNTPEGKRKYQGLQKLFSIFFIVFENGMYVLSGALPGATGTIGNMMIMIAQLIAGGFILMLLDEVVSKWGIGSGLSLFIVAGVSRQIFVNSFSPMIGPSGYPIGNILLIIVLIIKGFLTQAILPAAIILATIGVFMMATYLQALKVEIPLSFGRVRGFSLRWPLRFIYTSNIPVILTAAFLATLQFWGLSLYHMGFPVLGTYQTEMIPGGGQREIPVTGIVKYLSMPTIYSAFTDGWGSTEWLSLLTYGGLMLIGSVLFSLLWVSIGGQDAGTVADQMMSSGLSIPGFRSDKRILERMLNRYIKPLTIMGGFAVGFLAVVADLFSALSRGTGILLSVMIVFQFYESLLKEPIQDAHPIIKKVLGAGQ